ncbi:MAG: hypothetical protein ACI9KE_001098 [Polyangiales bacterium]|jgi:hypothetical protein
MGGRMKNIFLVVALLMVPSFASAQGGRGWQPRPDERDDDMAARLSGYFGVGFAGDARLRGGGFSGRGSLEPTLGFGLRFEKPIIRFLAIGGLLEFNSYNVSDGRDQRDSSMDFDVWVKGRYSLRAGDLRLVVYGGVPLGVSVLFLENTDNYRGFNTGLLAGLELVFGRFAPFFEIGWRHHWVRRKFDGFDDAKFISNQVRINFGASILF